MQIKNKLSGHCLFGHKLKELLKTTNTKDTTKKHLLSVHIWNVKNVTIYLPHCNIQGSMIRMHTAASHSILHVIFSINFMKQCMLIKPLCIRGADLTPSIIL